LNKNNFQDSEGDDRKSLALPYEQDKLINALVTANKNLTVLLCSGNAVEMPWLSKVPALVQTWYLGSEAGNAIANVLSGDVNPSGKLPFSFLKKLEDNAAISFGKISYPGDGKNEEYKDDILVGYRWFDTKKITPLFPFGFGMSYTTFEMSKAITDKTVYSSDDVIKLVVTIRNTGKVNGGEVVQAYISEMKPTVIRPLKELKAFSKIMLDAGEVKQVELTLPVKNWAFYDDKVSEWKINPGKYTINIGTSSSDIRQKINILIQ